MPHYTLSTKDKFGAYLFMAMQDKCYKIELTDKKLNEKVKIIVPEFYEKKGKLELTEERVHFVNQFLRSWFNEDFILCMQLLHSFSIRMDKSIEFFCKMNNLDLDVDINYETLKKKYYRWRDNMGQPMQKYIIELVETN